MELRTERLVLRPVSVADLDDLVVLHEDPPVQAVFGVTTRPEVEEWVARSTHEWEQKGLGRMTVFDREDGAFLGRCGLRHWPEFEEVEAGWALTPAARGRGIATEAGRACLDWGFRHLDVPYITAMIAPDNAASLAVAARLGMTPLRPDTLFGEPVIVHALPREERA